MRATSLAEYIDGYGPLMLSNGVTHFTPIEGCDIGRIAGTVALQGPPRSVWAQSMRCWIVLEWLRRELARPIIVTSGYRDPEYNRAVGGVDHSQHVQYTARDIQVPGMNPKEVADALEAYPLAHTLGIGRYRTFTHVDTRGRKARWGSNG